MTTILGQSKALDILRIALRSERFHHAWIFSGPRGVGKFTTAIELARILLDPQASRDFQTDSSSHSGPTRIQSLLDAGTHPDLHIIRKELVLYSDSRELRTRKQLNIPIDLLRERVIGGKVGETYHDAPAYRTAQLANGKVFIIDEAELLDPNAQNAMLKTLEEPPTQTYFFLITNQPERLLPTIRSRCQHVRFARLDQQAMREWFSRASGDASGARSPAMLAWVERFADGSPGVAQLAIEYGFHGWQTTLDPMLADLARHRFPLGMGAAMAELIEEFAVTWVKNHKNASKDAANKSGAKHLFSLLAAFAREQLDATVQRGGDVSRWLAVIDLLRDAERQLDSNVNAKLLLENLVAQWAHAGAPAA